MPDRETNKSTAGALERRVVIGEGFMYTEILQMKF